MERRGSYVLINETGLASDRNCYNLVEFLLSFGQAAELPLRGPYERSKNAGLGEFSLGVLKFFSNSLNLLIEDRSSE